MTSPNINAPLPRRALLKVPTQPRSVNMVHSILDAANVVAAEGLNSLTMNRVADVAGISIGSLYQYFANKESLVDGMIERTVLEAERLIKQFYLQNRDQPIDEYLGTILFTMLHLFDEVQQTTINVIQAMPLLAENSFMHQMEVILHDAIYKYLIHNSKRYRLKHGTAGLYIVVNAAIYLYLKWMVDYVKPCAEDAFIALMLEQMKYHIEYIQAE